MVRINVSNNGVAISSPRTSYSPKVSNRFEALSAKVESSTNNEKAKPAMRKVKSLPNLPSQVADPATPKAATTTAKSSTPKVEVLKQTAVAKPAAKGSSWRMPNLYNAVVIVAAVFLSFRSAPSEPNGRPALPNSPAAVCPNQQPVSTHQPMLAGSTAAPQLMIAGLNVSGMLPAPGPRPVEYSMENVSEVPNSTPQNGVEVAPMVNPISTEGATSAAVKTTVTAVNVTQAQNSTRKATKPKQRKIKIQQRSAPAVIAPIVGVTRGTVSFEYPRAAPPRPRTNFFRSY